MCPHTLDVLISLDLFHYSVFDQVYIFTDVAKNDSSRTCVFHVIAQQSLEHLPAYLQAAQFLREHRYCMLLYSNHYPVWSSVFQGQLYCQLLGGVGLWRVTASCGIPTTQCQARHSPCHAFVIRFCCRGATRVQSYKETWRVFHATRSQEWKLSQTPSRTGRQGADACYDRGSA